MNNLREPYRLGEVILRAPWWTITDIWPKRHVYFVRHLHFCDLAKRTLVEKRVLQIGRYFVQKAWIDYHAPMKWHEKLKIEIFLTGLHKKGRAPLLKYAIHSFGRNLLLAEAHFLYHPPLSRDAFQEGLFFDERLRKKISGLVADTSLPAIDKSPSGQ